MMSLYPGLSSGLADQDDHTRNTCIQEYSSFFPLVSNIHDRLLSVLAGVVQGLSLGPHAKSGPSVA